MTEADDRQLLCNVQRISDREMLLHKDVNHVIKHTREQAWWTLERECDRLDMKFDEAKVKATWEYRLELVTEPDPEREKRREVLKAWSEQPNPRLLAPNRKMGDAWLDMNRDLLTGLKSRSNVVVVGGNATMALRGYSGMLVIVQPGERRGEPPMLPDDFRHQIQEIHAYERFLTWGEILP